MLKSFYISLAMICAPVNCVSAFDLCSVISGIEPKNEKEIKNILKPIYNMNRIMNAKNDNNLIYKNIIGYFEPFKPDSSLVKNIKKYKISDTRGIYILKFDKINLIHISRVVGSGKCHDDIWAMRTKTSFYTEVTEPIGGSECDVVRYFGNLKGKNVMIQLEYRDSGEFIKTIRVVDLNYSNGFSGCAVKGLVPVEGELAP